MKVLGIIAEYNPFHKGHMYHIQRSRELTGADFVVVAMGGHIMQRGDLAICDKWKRAKMAVMGGADLVIELPAVYSGQSAENFARGGVELLESIGADYLAFGMESDRLDNLLKVAEFLKNPPEDFDKEIAQKMKEGISYPTARAKALEDFGFGEIADTPNDILAMEYLKAIKTMKPVGIKRIDSDHDGYGSASYIRSLIYEGKDYREFVPEFTKEILDEAMAEGAAPVRLDSLDTAVTAILRTMPHEQLAEIRDVNEGLENRIKSSADKFSTIKEITDNVKTKRYTHSRIRRIIMNAVLGVTKETAHLSPSYIRVLAMNDKGARLLKEKKEQLVLPVVTKVSVAEKDTQLELDFKATDIFSLAFPNGEKRKSNLDLTTSPIIKAQKD